MRAVLDPNVLISGLLAPAGSPAKVLKAWLDGAFELVVSPLLLTELERALRHPKISERIEPAEAEELMALLRRQANVIDDPSTAPPVRSPDPGDDYLIALAASARAVIVSGDGHLLGLAEDLPVYSPAEFLSRLEPPA
ncbi:MAG: putative toxin-antitoxin system toxin component, PIN family [Acidimicrobiia bacterium]